MGSGDEVRIYDARGEGVAGSPVRSDAGGYAVWRVPPVAAQGVYVCVLRCDRRTCAAEVVAVLP